jgi:hypothetical protein
MNKIIQLLRDGTQGKLNIGNATTSSVDGGSSVAIEVPIHTNKLLLKSIEVTANKNIDFRVEFFEESTHQNSRYNSGNVAQEVYDVLDLPYVDQEERQMMYFLIHNLSDVEATFTIEVRGIELK